jgi:RHS repeat-associated protein
MHEHLPEFNLINMNGRVYDPLTAIFFSPDPYLQAPGNWLNYNRYGYCLNNPFLYTDPNGEIVWFVPIIVGAIIGGAGYTANVAFSEGGFDNWNWGQFAASVGIGAVSGAITAGIGASFGAIGSNGITGEVLRAVSHGVANGMMSGIGGGSFEQGFASGALGSLAGSAFMMYGGSFANSPIGTYAFSGLAGGAGSALTGGNFGEGAAIGLMTAGLNHLAQGLQQKFTNAQLKEIYEAYRNDVLDYTTPEEFYEYIGGPLGEWAKNNPEQFGNTCAARLSKALNYSGFEIPKGTSGAYKGGDGKYYFINAKQMAAYLSKSKVWGSPTLLRTNQVVKNAVIFQTGFGGGVTGHLDVIYRGRPANHMYNTTTYWWH